MKSGGEKTNTALSLDKETRLPTTSGEGQVNFILVFDEGYSLNTLSVDGTYKNRKGPDETGVESGYRITKIESALTITVSSKADEAEEDLSQGFKVTFISDEHTHITVYHTQTLSDGEQTDVAYSRDALTGALTKDDGQVNFVVTCDEGYEVSSVAVDDAYKEFYKNLKDPSETKVKNCYRITKIKGAVTVKITSSPVSA
jgi:hypothetical protein